MREQDVVSLPIFWYDVPMDQDTPNIEEPKKTGQTPFEDMPEPPPGFNPETLKQEFQELVEKKF